MSPRFFAHTKPGAPEEAWEPLSDHLTKVADLAAEFAAPFGAEEWARLAGLWHDLGKFSDAFQTYLRQVGSPDSHVADHMPKTDHSTAGAKHAVAAVEVLGHLIAYVIAGHHSGLLDGRSDGACMEARLAKWVEPWARGVPREVLERPVPSLPAFLQAALRDPKSRAFPFAFFTRFLFSCLVDADSLATESFMNPEQAAKRPVWPTDVLARMSAALDEHMTRRNHEPTNVNPEVHRARARVREACLAAAEDPPGLFSLTVPTGGGKTLSSLAFALRHATRHGLRRVVYVAPFTTIIEQNAHQMREALRALMASGLDDPVLEHHSNFDVENETIPSLLAAENWDAPLIVTTSVQFYESIFGSSRSRCRKLHNLAGSVIILDEAQTIPVEYLAPCLQALRELSLHYGSTVVLCTATQPAIHLRPDFPIGLEGVREIARESHGLYTALRRVEVRDLGALDDKALSRRLLQEERVLCIVNTRSHARKLYESLGEGDGHFHLSALMCPRHRSEVVRRIRDRLERGGVCRVVSTQLIEAGVDIDFPTVFRGLAGIDSIAQAAGRCNRNGTLAGLGRTYVFRSEHVRSERYFSDTANCARQLLMAYHDPLTPEAIEHYFRLYYWEQQARWDAKGILDEFHLSQDRELPFLFRFSTVAERFKLIEDGGRPVVVPWDETGSALCRELRNPARPLDRDLLRRLQPYTVQVPANLWHEHLGECLELARDRYAVLISPQLHYSQALGLRLEGGPSEALIA
jgi:CRISPR-associated endonuclease/helicase Cas3